ncbi:MAG TPA: hypothetical protein VFW89_05160 [Gemmatimonadaceae bacterium]|nr:hypothetical protein [Gemmatimonadaceae bacterium]
MSPRQQITTGISIGLIAFFICTAEGAFRAGGHLFNFTSTSGDFYQLWVMARSLLDRLNPYAVGCPVTPPCADARQYYPLTAGVAILPFGLAPAGFAGALFVGVCAGLLGYAVVHTGMWRAPMLLSWPFIVAVGNGQCAPLLVAAALLPGMRWLYPMKPQLGAALWIWRPSWRAGGLSLLLVALSLVLDPRWPAHWWAVASKSPYVRSPILDFAWFAPVLLLAALRWRTPEGRLLLAMAILPQTPFAYDQLALWLIPRTHRESLTLTWLSWAAFGTWLAFTFDWQTREVRLTTWAPYIIALLFIPCLWMVLRRPNLPMVEEGAERDVVEG